MEENKQLERNIINRDHDSWDSEIDGIALATHFYYMSKGLEGLNGVNLKPFTHSGVILSMLYVPFLEEKDLTLKKIPYDQKYFGQITKPDDPHDICEVYKIHAVLNHTKKIGEFKAFPTYSRQSGKHWKNEGKLFQYPYNYITINDYINAPLKIVPHLLINPYDENIPVTVKQTVGITGGYTMYVPHYKGDDNDGANEGMMSCGPLDLPTSSTQYAQFMATSKAQFDKANEIAVRNATAGHLASGPGLIQSAISGAMQGGSMAGTMGLAGGPAVAGALGMAGSLVGGVLSVAKYSTEKNLGIENAKRNAIELSQAKMTDIMSAPRNVALSSADIMMTINRSNRQVWFNRFHIQEYYLNKLCDFFTLYGYKQNKLMNININNRKYWNYIKTIDVNIDGVKIDKEDLEAIRSIFNNGIRFWHNKRCKADGIKMFDYNSKDNSELP